MQGLKGCEIHVEGGSGMNCVLWWAAKYGKIPVTSTRAWNASLEPANNIGFGFPK